MLTDHAIREIALQVGCTEDDDGALVNRLARAIEQAATAPLLARIAELEAKLAEAQKDAARLDYVATGKVTVSRDNGGFQLAWYDHNSQKLKWQNSWHETARAAIDAAMRENSNG